MSINEVKGKDMNVNYYRDENMIDKLFIWMFNSSWHVAEMACQSDTDAHCRSLCILLDEV